MRVMIGLAALIALLNKIDVLYIVLIGAILSMIVL